MNIIVNLGASGTAYNASADFLLENSNDVRPATTTQDVIWNGRYYGGWTVFFAQLEVRLSIYPDAKVFIGYSGAGFGTEGHGTWSPPDDYFKIVQNNPSDRNQGFTLQRKENGIWVNVHVDTTSAKELFYYMNNTIRPNAYEPLPSWINKHWISFNPNIFLDV